MSSLRALSCAALLAVALLAAGRAARAAVPATEPPFHISADNLTGGHDASGDVLFLNGNLRVVRGRTVLTSDTGRYTRATGLIDLMGRVRLVDSTTTVTCDHALFSENDDRLNLDGNVVVVDRDAILRSPTGWYDRRTGEAHATGGVTGTEKKQRLQADEATYLRDSMIVRARGHVHGFDDANKVELVADSIDFHRRTHLAIATGSPWLKQLDDDGHATILRALRLRVDSEDKVAEAIDSVTVERDTLRARADYARFDDKTGVGMLLGSPRAWDQETTVSGDTLETRAVEHKLRSVVVRHKAIMDYAGLRDANAGEASRLTGNRLVAFVTENRIDSLAATGDAKNDYRSPSKAGKTNEHNLASGDTILVYFVDRKIERARVQGNATGEYRPAVTVGDTVAMASEVIRYDGRHIDFVVPKNRIVLDGKAHLTYRELELNASQVEFDSQKQTLVAKGKPRLLDRGDKVDGRTMTYDLGSRVGTIYEAKTAYEKGIYRGEKIRKVGDNELDVMNGSYSTCDLDHPHYHFAAHWMKIYLKDKLVAKPVVFYLRNVPIMALPFYVFPIKPGRHSGFVLPQFQFGFNNKAGQFIRNAGYYWAPNDYMDLTLGGDYYQAAPSYAIRADGNYKLLYKFDGTFQGQYQHDESTKQNDYIFSGSHSQDLSPRTRLIATGNFVSSANYSQTNYSSTLEQRLNRFLTSTVSISHSAEWASFNATVDRRQDLDADESVTVPFGSGNIDSRSLYIGKFATLPSLTVNAPSLTVGFPTRTLGSLALFKHTHAETLLASTYVSVNARFISAGTKQAYLKGWQYATDATGARVDSASVLGQQEITRRAFESNFSISDARRLWGWLNAAPGIDGSAVVFDFDERGHKIAPAATWSSHMALSTTYYGTFKPPIPHVTGLRHVIFPSIGLNFSPAFSNLQYRDSLGVLHDRFNGFSGISISGSKSANLSFGLDQRFQLKLKNGDKVTRLDNLLSWTTNGGYDFLWREHGLPHGLSSLPSQLRLTPPGGTSAELTGVFDVYQGRPLRTMSFNLGTSFSSSGTHGQPAQLASDPSARRSELGSGDSFRERWQASMAYSYSGGYQLGRWTAQKTVNGTASYQMTPNWHFDYSAAYDLTLSHVLTQNFGLTRRIHCWDAAFTRSFTPGGQAEYYFRLAVHDQKEIYFERGTRSQSYAGIQ